RTRAGRFLATSCDLVARHGVAVIARQRAPAIVDRSQRTPFPRMPAFQDVNINLLRFMIGLASLLIFGGTSLLAGNAYLLSLLALAVVPAATVELALLPA